MERFRIFRSVRFIQACLLIVGVAALVFGIYRDEIKTVLTKAIYICLECIGIG